MPTSIMHDILELGVNSRASDWHVKEDSPITIRIDGRLVDTDMVASKEIVQKTVAAMLSTDTLKNKLNETGDADLSFVEDGVGRFRVNIHKQRGMVSLALRHVKRNIMSIEELGVPQNVKRIAESERGIIIVSGTTGSGKSTTLASIIEYINQNFRKHIVTVEDPIEYEFQDKESIIEQREIGLDTVTFESALVHVLRQDPDVIMIGEMRDKESFDAALQASDTGHLVLTTLHATNSSQAVNRILDFYDRSEQDAIRGALAINIKSIMCQRLIRRAFGGGVIPGLEILINTPIIRKMLEENKIDKLHAAVETGKEDGMQSFNQSLLSLVNEGLITEEDALKMASNPEALKMNLKGIFLDSRAEILG
ncbi:MAG: twitching motility protein [Lentisphaerae bacterium GWF2_49_21]|nr:MAG: twitching motility protein [Lentisphaerae bacterium GWF2_49_21]